MLSSLLSSSPRNDTYLTWWQQPATPSAAPVFVVVHHQSNSEVMCKFLTCVDFFFFFWAFFCLLHWSLRCLHSVPTSLERRRNIQLLQFNRYLTDMQILFHYKHSAHADILKWVSMRTLISNTILAFIYFPFSCCERSVGDLTTLTRTFTLSTEIQCTYELICSQQRASMRMVLVYCFSRGS